MTYLLRLATFICLSFALSNCGPATTTRNAGVEAVVMPVAYGNTQARAGALVNSQRAAHGLRGLRHNAALQRAAAGHAADMERNNFLGHISSNGATVRQRGNRQGYRACWYGEVVAFGQDTADIVVNDWMNSPPHRRIMLHRRAVEYGIARGPADAWVIVFAQPGCR